MNARNVIGATFTTVLLATAVAGIFTARGWTYGARLFPFAIGFPTLGLLALLLTLDILRVVKPPEGGGLRVEEVADLPVDDSVPDRVVVRRSLEAFGWIAGVAVGIALVGFLVTIPVFVLAYLWWRAEARPATAVVGTGIIVIFIVVVFDGLIGTAWNRPYFRAPQDAILSLLGS